MTNIANNVFHFKQFSIIQEKSAMKVGTDGVLLGAWGEIAHSALRMLDIGTGTGVIALMLAQRFPNAMIDAIEIDHDAAEEAALNAKNSPWAERINVINTSLNNYQLSIFNFQLTYDLIVINPPFYNSTLKPDEESRAVARHADSLPFKDVTAFADKYLSENGRLAVIYPTNNEENIMLGVAASSLKILKVCDVITKLGKPCKRRMLLLGKSGEGGAIHETLYLRNENNEYSAEYRAITKDFYISLN
nr:methyltransferase domain protein [uncultured bacterium]